MEFDNREARQWTVEDEKKVIFDRNSEITEMIRKMQDKIKEGSQDYIHLDDSNNLGIQFNNKVVELSHVFKNAGIEFYRGSALKYPILYKLQTLLSEGIKNIESYAKTFELDDKELNKKVSKEYAESVIESANQYVKEYQNCSDSIYSFNIENDIVDSIAEYYEANRDVWELITDKGSIGGFEEELQALGYGHLTQKLQIALQQRGYNNQISDNNKQYVHNNDEIEVNEDISYDDDENIREPVVSGKDPMDINRVYAISLQKVQAQIKSTGQKIPGVSAALKSRLLDYMEEGATAFTNGDMKNYENAILKMQSFNIENKIVESISVYEAYWKDVNEFHGVKSIYKEELAALGYEDKIPAIEQSLKDNKYEAIVEEKESKINTYQKDMLQDVKNNFTPQEIGKATVNCSIELKRESEEVEMSKDTELENGGAEYDAK